MNQKKNQTVGIAPHGLGRGAFKAGAETRFVRRRPAQDLQTPQRSVTATRLLGKIAGTRRREYHCRNLTKTGILNSSFRRGRRPGNKVSWTRNSGRRSRQRACLKIRLLWSRTKSSAIRSQPSRGTPGGGGRRTRLGRSARASAWPVGSLPMSARLPRPSSMPSACRTPA